VRITVSSDAGAEVGAGVDCATGAGVLWVCAVTLE
jgi:hypothetical protein